MKGNKYMIKQMSLILYIFLVSCLTALPVFAGCISDCKYEYESEVSSCQMIWGDDPDDDYMLKSCIDDAKSEYESCEDECKS